jgi:hypothetical protein
VLADYPKISSDKAYAEERTGAREVYEGKVAYCYLEYRRPEKAMALAREWPATVDGLKVMARAHAQLDKEAECRAALEKIAQAPGVDASFFVEVPEFQNYAGADWFKQLALSKWASGRYLSLEDFAAKLVQRSRENLLSLKVAAADAQRPAGEWAIWTGAVRGSEIDRASGQTILKLEGMDVRTEARVTSVETRVTGPDQFEMTPRYDGTSREEIFVPNGLGFIVRYPEVSEQLVTLQTILVFGRYVGRSGDEGWPTLTAFMVVPRTQ